MYGYHYFCCVEGMKVRPALHFCVPRVCSPGHY